MADLLAAYRHTTRNRAEVEASALCGCCCCMQSFRPSEIVAYTGLDIEQLDDPAAESAETALCPRCGGEAVIGDKSGYKIDVQFLGRMNEAWFQSTIVHRPKPPK